MNFPRLPDSEYPDESLPAQAAVSWSSLQWFKFWNSRYISKSDPTAKYINGSSVDIYTNEGTIVISGEILASHFFEQGAHNLPSGRTSKAGIYYMIDGCNFWVGQWVIDDFGAIYF